MRNPFIILIGIISLSSCDLLNDVLNSVGTTTADPTEAEVASGLKEALTSGISKGSDALSKVDGYFGNPKIKIPFPPEAKKIEDKLRALGLNKMCDDVILSVNRASEDAAKEAKPIIVNAIKAMTVKDAMNILFGGDTTASHYLRVNTSTSLRAKFKPVIQTSLEKVSATQYWDDAVTYYNAIPFVEDLNPDLAEFVTGKALNGLFYKIKEEEKYIRENPIARVTALLKKVFDYYSQNK